MLCPVLGPSIQESSEALECVQRREMELVQGLEHESCEEWLRELGSSLDKRRLGRDLLALNSSLKGGRRQMRVRFFPRNQQQDERTQCSGEPGVVYVGHEGAVLHKE